MTYRIAFRHPTLATPALPLARSLRGLHDEVDRAVGTWFGQSAEPTDAAWTPATDVIEDETGWTVLLDLPGVPPEAVEVVTEERVLRVRGERAEAPLREGAAPRQQERRSGRFDRRFRLPTGADAETLSAELAHGVLTLRIGKVQPVQARRVPVTTPASEPVTTPATEPATEPVTTPVG
jgi:HSP20 family protein